MKLLLLSILLCFIWGFNFVVMKLGNGLFSPVMFAALRFLTGTLFLVGIVIYKRTRFPEKKYIKWYILCGILQTTYFNIAIQVSLNYISAGLTSVLTYSMPLFLCMMAHHWIPSERLTYRKLIGVVIGLIGLAVAMDIHFGGNTAIILLALSSAVSWALSNLIIKIKLQHADKIQFNTWQMACGTIGLLLYSMLFENHHVTWTGEGIAYILFSGVIASSIAFVVWTYLLSKMEASTASISLLTVPIIGIISGWIFLGEQLNGITLLGVTFVLIGIWVVNSKKHKLHWITKKTKT